MGLTKKTAELLKKWSKAKENNCTKVSPHNEWEIQYLSMQIQARVRLGI